MNQKYSVLGEPPEADEPAYQKSIKDLRAMANGSIRITPQMKTDIIQLLEEVEKLRSDPTVQPEVKEHAAELLALVNTFAKDLARVNNHNVLNGQLRTNNKLDPDLRERMCAQLLKPAELSKTATSLVEQAAQIKVSVEQLSNEHDTGYRTGNIVLALVLGVVVIGLAIIVASLVGWKEKSIFRNPPEPIVTKARELTSQIEEELMAIRLQDKSTDFDQGDIR